MSLPFLKKSVKSLKFLMSFPISYSKLANQENILQLKIQTSISNAQFQLQIDDSMYIK